MTTKAISQKEKAQTKCNFLGLWRNQHGSELNVTGTENGRITGTFKTGVGACDPEEEHDVVGFVSDSLICFSVNFGKYNSLTSWTGQHVPANGEDKIEMMWHLARTLPEKLARDAFWTDIWTGADFFYRVDPFTMRNLDQFVRPRSAPSHPTSIAKNS